MSIWDKIDQCLKERDMTIAELAKAIRPTDPSVLYAMRDGRTKSPFFSSMVKIAAALDVGLDVFSDCKM